MHAVLVGARRPHEDFWKLSGVLDTGIFKHTPFIVLTKLPANYRTSEVLEQKKFMLDLYKERSAPDSAWDIKEYTSKVAPLESEIAELEKINMDTSIVEGIVVHDKLSQLLDSTYDDETKIIKAWQGQWRSDYFVFTVGELRERLKK